MTVSNNVLEYKCPCCGAGLPFSGDTQKMSCEYCGTEFDMESIQAYNASLQETDASEFQWEEQTSQEWSAEETESMVTFVCPSCGGEIITDSNTAATFCPFCENPTILPGRVSGGLKPDAILPFKTTKEDAQKAFLELCKGKPLLPKMFTQQNRIEKITGIYVPFWLYDCTGNYSGSYSATQSRHWSDTRYFYTRTDYYLLRRDSTAQFAAIPMDASSKMDNAIMESIEPFDYNALVDFDMAFLSGFFADKYDVKSETGQERIRQRVNSSMETMLASSFTGFSSVVPKSRQLHVAHGKAKYVLLPVWMLHTKYEDKTYVFAMNGQTGKMTGTFPVCPRESRNWFLKIGGIAAAIMLAILSLAAL